MAFTTDVVRYACIAVPDFGMIEYGIHVRY